MRRRLWYSICILDLQTALETGSRAAIAHNGLMCQPPLCIDDADIFPALDRTPVQLPGFTDMTFASMTHDAFLCLRRFTHVPTDLTGQPTSVTQDWATRFQILRDWEPRLRSTYLIHCDDTQPFQAFTRLVGEGMIVTVKLLERRPLLGMLTGGPPPGDSFDILEVATDVLETSLLKQMNQSLTPWAWHAWAKWYALAVALAEVCGGSRGPQVDRAWSIIEATFPQVILLVEDDALRRSLEKLLARAQLIRNGLQLPLNPLRSRNGPDASSSGETQNGSQLSTSNPHEPKSGWYEQDVYQHSAYDGPAQNEVSQGTSLENGLEALQNVSMNETEPASWINWERFMQDIALSDEPALLDPQMLVQT